MMTHYLETKKQYPDCILFYRLGDFYEMFFDDALTASRELEITLTGKECGMEERAPMCGVPYHAVDSYLYRLVQKGYKVTIAEQMEDPKQAKGLVKREVIRVVTPGTITSSQALDETKNNYLMGIVYLGNVYGVSACDITTGDYLVTEVENERALLDEISKFSPSEIICNEAFYMSGADLDDLRSRYQTAVSSLDGRYFSDEGCRKVLKEHFHVSSLEGLGLADHDAGVLAAGAVMEYLYETQKSSLDHITNLTIYSAGQYMIIDSSTRRNLELVETLREKQRRADAQHGGAAADPERRDRKAAGRGGRAESQLHFQRRDPGILKSGLRSGTAYGADQLQNRRSQGPGRFLQLAEDAALYPEPGRRIPLRSDEADLGGYGPLRRPLPAD